MCNLFNRESVYTLLMWNLINILLVSFWPFMDHDIHVSICEIEMSGEQMEVTLKTFLDDLQIAVGLVPGEELNCHSCCLGCNSLI